MATTLRAAVAALRAGETTSVALVEALVARAEETAHLGAFITLGADHALAAARAADASAPRGPLHGVPLAIKDNIHVAGLPSTAGTAALRDFAPTADAPVVARLRAAGAIVLGKTNLHELAFGVTGENPTYGDARNAHDPACFPGGSSSGTAVAIAAGSALAGLGTDTGGSTRIPAALNGICGLRPTQGRYPAGGIAPIASTMDTAGPMAATVDDLALLDAVVCGDADELDRIDPAAIRLGLPSGLLTAGLDPALEARWHAALDRLRAAGVALVPVDAARLSDTAPQLDAVIALYEVARELPAYLAEHTPAVTIERLVAGARTHDVRGVLERSIAPGAPEPIAEADYRAARDQLPGLRAGWAALFAEHRLDAVAFPTTPRLAGTLEHDREVIDVAGERLPTFNVFTRNTLSASVAGLPGLSVPLDEELLPAGLELDGPAGSDRRLLAVGATIAGLLAPARVP